MDGLGKVTCENPRLCGGRHVPLKGILAVMGGILAHITYGTLFTFGNLGVYVTSYMRLHVDPGLSHSTSMLIYSLTIAAQGGFMPLGGQLSRKLGLRWTMLLGSLLHSGSVMLSYFTVDHALWSLTLTYGILRGMGIAFAYVPPMAIGMMWFPRRKGLVNGVVIAGFGFGSFIFTQVQTAFLNPENVPPEKDGYFSDADLLSRVRPVFLLEGSAYLGLQLLGFLLIRQPPTAPQTQTHAEAEQEERKPRSRTSSSVIGCDDFTPLEMLRTKEFYMLWTSFMSNQLVTAYATGMYKAYGQTFIVDDYFLAMVGALAAIFNAGGRTAWGMLMDRTSYRTCMLLLSSLLAALLFSLVDTEVGGKPMFAAWVWLIFFTFSGCFSLLPTVTAQTFGKKHYGTNYGLVFTSSVVSGPVIAVVSVTLTDLVGWFWMFFLLGCCAGVTATITFFYPDIASAKH